MQIIKYVLVGLIGIYFISPNCAFSRNIKDGNIQLSKSRKHKRDSITIGKCFNNLLYNGYNPKDYRKFINNTYYGEYPIVDKKHYFAFGPSNNAPNKSLAKKIYNMFFLDQIFRKKWFSGSIDEDEKDDWPKVALIDSANQHELIKMVQKYGKLPGEKEIGYAGMHQMIIILRHLGGGKPEVFEYLCPVMVKQAIAGDFPPIEIAGIIDYYCMGNKPVFIDSTHFFDTQIYGTATIPLEGKVQILMPNTTTSKKRILVPIPDWEQMEILRKEIGLKPLKEELEQNSNLIYDEELYKSKFTFEIKK